MVYSFLKWPCPHIIMHVPILGEKVNLVGGYNQDCYHGFMGALISCLRYHVNHGYGEELVFTVRSTCLLICAYLTKKKLLPVCLFRDHYELRADAHLSQQNSKEN